MRSNWRRFSFFFFYLVPRKNFNVAGLEDRRVVAFATAKFFHSMVTVPKSERRG